MLAVILSPGGNIDIADGMREKSEGGGGAILRPTLPPRHLGPVLSQVEDFAAFSPPQDQHAWLSGKLGGSGLASSSSSSTRPSLDGGGFSSGTSKLLGGP